MRVDRIAGWFRAWLSEEGLKASTITNKLAYIAPFIDYLDRIHICTTEAISRETTGAYCAGIRSDVSARTGKPLVNTTIKCRVSALRILMVALYDAGHIDRIILPPSIVHGQDKPLMTILDEGDVSSFLESIKTDSPIGLRDRALFELIYGSGLRASEASRLKWEDINLEARRAVIRQSKFDKDRVVPITHEAAEMFRRYRQSFRVSPSFVFPGNKGQGLSSTYINKRFKALCERAELYRSGMTTHQLRHACATHLIAHGANIRYVQDLLGHESIQTTVRYTRELTDEVQKAYRRYHPRENTLYETTGGRYETRIADLATRIGEARKRTLAKKQGRMVH